MPTLLLALLLREKRKEKIVRVQLTKELLFITATLMLTATIKRKTVEKPKKLEVLHKKLKLKGFKNSHKEILHKVVVKKRKKEKAAKQALEQFAAKFAKNIKTLQKQIS